MAPTRNKITSISLIICTSTARTSINKILNLILCYEGQNFYEFYKSYAIHEIIPIKYLLKTFIITKYKCSWQSIKLSPLDKSFMKITPLKIIHYIVSHAKQLQWKEVWLSKVESYQEVNAWRDCWQQDLISHYGQRG